MRSSHLVIRDLINLELSRAKIISEFTLAEKNEIDQINKPNFSYGAVGEYGIRKALTTTKVEQNFLQTSREFWWDWYIPATESYWEVKSQPWWGERLELVLQDNNSGLKTNFQDHYNDLDALLIWSLKPDGDTITPLALIDPVGFFKKSYDLSVGRGIAASALVLLEWGYLIPINDEWRSKLLRI